MDAHFELISRVMPMYVFCSRDVCATAKLLYGLIALEQYKHGACYETNAYMAEVLGVAPRTITRCIAELIQAGFVAAVNDDGREIYCISRSD